MKPGMFSLVTKKIPEVSDHIQDAEDPSAIREHYSDSRD
jgi:hypothetical protein